MNTTPPPDGPGDECTIGDYIAYLAPSNWAGSESSVPDWPPDMFAIVASLLNITGAYCKVVAREAVRIDWEPSSPDATWAQEMAQVGKEWREEYSERVRSGEGPLCPSLVAQWWAILMDCIELPLCACGARDLDGFEGEDAETQAAYWTLCRTLLNLMAASDEACAGVGFPQLSLEQAGDDQTRRRLSEWFLEYDTVRESHRNSRYGTTICKYIHPSRVRVLPKLHTPRMGMTLRSLSLHLALCPADEAKVTWDNVSGWRPSLDKHLNVLIVPWPMDIQPRDITPVNGGLDGDAHPNHNLFAYEPVANSVYKDRGVARFVHNLLRESASVVGEGGIHMVVLPEVAVTTEEYNELQNLSNEHNFMLISGVRAVSSSGHRSNYLSMYLESSIVNGINKFEQYKHHRWFLDSKQIMTYGLASRLYPDAGWWEAIEIVPRSLRCVALRDWLYVCALICEDLARQDPMAGVVRSIGPSLLVALLMDGPQLATRWPSRYASVLADDPGTSVLTVTSLGMVKLSHAMRSSSEFTMRRTIASWKDSQTGLNENLQRGK